MGKKIVLTGVTLTDADAPRLARVDPIESAGSLMLIEPMHPFNPWPDGVPDNGASVPNLVAPFATAVYGSAPPDPTIAYANLDGTTRGKIERSGKGGIHGIISQADARIAESPGQWPYLRLNLDTAFRAWQYNNPDNDLYLSIWGRITRAMRSGTVGGTYTNGASRIAHVATANSNLRVPMGQYAEDGGAKMYDLGRRVVSELTADPAFGNAASSGWSTGPNSTTQTLTELVTIGGTGANNTVKTGVITALSRWPSWVIYRVYLEDLTVSERTYAEVDALDYALYTKHVLTAGGRYYGDTFTDPATIP